MVILCNIVFLYLKVSTEDTRHNFYIKKLCELQESHTQLQMDTLQSINNLVGVLGTQTDLIQQLLYVLKSNPHSIAANNEGTFIRLLLFN